MPDITPAQIGALLTAIVSQVVAWGWIDNNEGQRIVSVGGFVLAMVWKIADAYLRGQRVKAVHPAPTPASSAPAPQA